MEKIVESFELYGKQYRLETGELAKQATGSVVVTQGDTTVLVTAVISKEEKDYDFFPLTVDFIEKMYAVGRIPGGYLKREARPSDKGTLTARMVDRPIRPGFADGFKREVHVVCTTLVVRQHEPARHHLRHGRQRCPHAGRGSLRRPRRLRAHRPRRGDGRVHREPHVRGIRELRSRADHRRHGRLHLHGGGRRRRDLRRGHAGRHDVRPGGHRRVLRSPAALPRPCEHRAGRVARPRRRPGHRRARRAVHGRDVRRAARRRQAFAHGQGGRAQGRASRRSSSPTRSAPHGRATSPPSSRSSRRRPCARWSSRRASAPTAVVPRTSARCTSCRATCPACTARACSSAARRRCSPSARSAC